MDEEQRFGVRHKERLKKLRASVDVLTLTATPIPRTLHLSLTGVRDLSLIQTPPRDRMPIITHVLSWSDQILGEAVHREMDRGGQVFLVHNRVETIHTVAARIQRLEPEASVGVAHGQMPPRQLDEVMRDFVDGALDILVCTSIIENGLDVPNANTLIVDGADRFGLVPAVPDPGAGGSVGPAGVLLSRGSGDGHGGGREATAGSGALHGPGERVLGGPPGPGTPGIGKPPGGGPVRLRPRRGVGHLPPAPAKDRRTAPKRGRREWFTRNRISPSPLPLFSRTPTFRTPDRSSTSTGGSPKCRGPGEVEELRRELVDRFGPFRLRPRPSWTGRLSVFWPEGLGVERIMLKGREGRVSFLRGVVPALAHLDKPFQDRQVEVEVKRLDPLSLVLRQAGAQPLAGTLKEAFAVLSRAQADGR